MRVAVTSAATGSDDDDNDDDAVNITSHHLLISEAELADDNHYECQVGATDSTPGLQSRKAALTVQGKLLLTYRLGCFMISVTTAGFFPLDLGFLGFVWVLGYFTKKSGVFHKGA